jgi:hypothetical protein
VLGMVTGEPGAVEAGLAGAGPGATLASDRPGTGDPNSDARYPAPRAWIYDDDFRSGLIDFARKFRDRNHGPDALWGIVVLFARHWHRAAKATWLALFAAALVAPSLDFWAALGTTADHRPATALTPAVADTCARILLIAPAAPPAPVAAIAGATG